MVGDWDGNGKDTLAVRRGSDYYFKNSIAGGNADKVITYGRVNDAVLVGDWDGDGKDTLAVRRAPTAATASHPASTPLATVHGGAYCSPEGDKGKSDKSNNILVCKKAKDGRLRWMSS